MKDKHIAVSEETKKKFDSIKDHRGMTQDGLIRYWIKQDKNSTDDGK